MPPQCFDCWLKTWNLSIPRCLAPPILSAPLDWPVWFFHYRSRHGLSQLDSARWPPGFRREIATLVTWLSPPSSSKDRHKEKDKLMLISVWSSYKHSSPSSDLSEILNAPIWEEWLVKTLTSSRNLRLNGFQKKSSHDPFTEHSLGKEVLTGKYYSHQ